MCCHKRILGGREGFSGLLSIGAWLTPQRLQIHVDGFVGYARKCRLVLLSFFVPPGMRRYRNVRAMAADVIAFCPDHGHPEATRAIRRQRGPEVSLMEVSRRAARASGIWSPTDNSDVSERSRHLMVDDMFPDGDFLR